MTDLFNIFLKNPSVTTDSRNVPQGSIFFALRGDKFDGNRYAEAALAAGAAYAVVDDVKLFEQSPQEEFTVPIFTGYEQLTKKTVRCGRYIYVPDVLRVLQGLAAEYRHFLHFPIIAITGTNGKTTTKELVASVLSRKGAVGMTPGNLNNHIGVPLTILSFDRKLDYGVVEMGASAVGDIYELCGIGRPGYGIITNVGKAHLEGFGSMEGVIKAKGELFDYLDAMRGTAFWCRQEREVDELLRGREWLHMVEYSEKDVEDYSTHLVGEYNRRNMAAAAAVGKYFEVPVEQIREAIETYRPDNMRSQRLDTVKNTVIADCYNANPSSMAAAVTEFLKNYEPGRDLLILGDMLELGEFSKTEHEAVIALLDELPPSDAILVGSEFSHAQDPAKFPQFENVQQLKDHLVQHPLLGRRILLKGSRGIGLETVIPFL